MRGSIAKKLRKSARSFTLLEYKKLLPPEEQVKVNIGNILELAPKGYIYKLNGERRHSEYSFKKYYRLAKHAFNSKKS